MQHSSKRLCRMASAMFSLSVGRLVKRQPDLKETEIEECVQQALLRNHSVCGCETDFDFSRPRYGSGEVCFWKVARLSKCSIESTGRCVPARLRGGAIEIRGWPCSWDGHSPHSTSDEERREHSRIDNAYRLDIRDSGPLIPPSHLESIFEEYTSYNGSRDRSGGGLGLAICRMIISRSQWVCVGPETQLTTRNFRSMRLAFRIEGFGSQLD